jgi:hypothetical protein
MSEHKARGTDVEVNEAYDGSGATYDFFAQGLSAILHRRPRHASRLHRALRHVLRERAVERPADGLRRRRWPYLPRFTASVDVIAHELTHGVTQHAAALGYSGQTGALNEHLSDAFGIMVKQYTLGQTADESDWLIGADSSAPPCTARRALAGFSGHRLRRPVLGATRSRRTCTTTSHHRRQRRRPHQLRHPQPRLLPRRHGARRQDVGGAGAGSGTPRSRTASARGRLRRLRRRPPSILPGSSTATAAACSGSSPRPGRTWACSTSGVRLSTSPSRSRASAPLSSPRARSRSVAGRRADRFSHFHHHLTSLERRGIT